jgi:hypothetical protein
VRVHRVFPDLQPWVALPDRIRELATADRLVAARIEPVTRGREPAAFLDLAFASGDESVAIPLIYIDLAQLDVREVDPLVFPAAYAPLLDDARARSLVDRLFADLELRAHRGGFRAEEVLFYGDAPLFVRAREAGLFGAAPLARSIPAIAAAVYAQRFARAARVLTYGPQADESAAFLRARATRTTVVGGNATAAAWYATSDREVDGAGYDLAVGEGPPPQAATTVVRTDAGAPGLAVPVARPLPGDLLLSFDPADGPAVTTFYVTSGRDPFRRPAGVIPHAGAGGSAGRITLVVRPDAARVPDSDTDEAHAFAAYLAREGFTPTVVASVDGLAASAPDLVHLFGVRPGGFARRVAAWANDHGVPLAVHAYAEEPERGGYWGTMIAPYCFGYSADDRSVASYLEMLGRRAVEVDGVGPNVPFAPPAAGLADAERVLRAAEIVYVQSEREREAVARVRPAGLTLVVPPLPLLTGTDEPVGAYIGGDAFVLVHAPLGPMHNQLVLARTAADMGIGLVLAGPVEDPVYAERVREFAADVRIVPEPPPGVLATLYRSAAVVADAAWVTRGHARMASAAAAGAAVVVSASRWLDLPLPERWRVDPADVLSVARGIGGALDAAARHGSEIVTAADAARERLAAGGMTIVAGYAKITSGV